MFISTEAFPGSHQVLGIVNATSHLMLKSNEIDQFSAMDQLFSDVEEQLKARAESMGANGVVGVRFSTDVANVQVAPRFLVLTGYGTAIKVGPSQKK